MYFAGIKRFQLVAATLVAATIWPVSASATQSEVHEKSQNSSGSFILDVVESKPEKITDKNHPDYVRCRTEPVIGSLARKRRVCMTNEQWEEAARVGNRFADDAISSIQGMSGGGSDANNGN